MIRSVIVENETKAQKLLSAILREFVTDVELLGLASSVAKAINLIESLKPDLVFLDIELDDGNAFDLLEQIDHRSFKIIFITAYDRFALKAFEYEAIDYIVKPYSPGEIAKAVKRVEHIPFFESFRDELLDLLKKDKYDNARITVSNSDGLTLIRVGDIIRLEGERSYCTFILKNGEKIVVARPLKEFELSLPADNFYRVHQTHLINLKFVKKVLKEDGGFVVMENDERVPIAKRRKKDFINLLDT